MLARVERAAPSTAVSMPSWWPDWSGQCAAIVACGPSAKHAKVEQLRGIRTIAINESYQLCPWADFLYACDHKWWHLRRGVPDFKGIKLAWADPGKELPPDVKTVKIKDKLGDKILIDEPGTIGAGGNSGFQALNLAVQFGALQIMLVGFDMHGRGGEHWHGRHPPPCSNPTEDNYRRWQRAFDGNAPMLRALGVQIINCSPTSVLGAFPKMTLDAAMARWRL